MNTFVTFKYFDSAEGGASVYTAILHTQSVEGNAVKSEFDKFLDRYEMEEEKEPDFKEILAQIDVILTHGFENYQLRHEREARALPSKDRSLVSAGYMPTDGPLRLYCVLLPDNVMVLCGGGVKAEDTAQESDGVRAHFMLANTLARKLNERLAEETKPISYERVEAILEKETIYL
ncbi:hypothetical protein QWY85_06875 [Neolewinella lacunae]|uniref:Uncharacterized protein n=1 Tax=Neolewinella lacunae TaxID=1517758 RepID=A0A923TDE4_9BACT|nr:hypothetical protein [Neolewinella lacunae]MBC6994752.1 hypothetical protein [Neolewinella lacunae]MDN3634374.1 hypothetical protein [Neolewinella lacunae]